MVLELALCCIPHACKRLSVAGVSCKFSYIRMKWATMSTRPFNKREQKL